MPELGPYGSVLGALSNERPYRDSGAPGGAVGVMLIFDDYTDGLENFGERNPAE